MTGPYRHGPTRPPLPHHPSVAQLRTEHCTPDERQLLDEVAQYTDDLDTDNAMLAILELADARDAVVHAAIAETRAEDLVDRHSAAFTAPKGDPRIRAHAQAVTARAAAREDRRTAVRQLLDISQEQPE